MKLLSADLDRFRAEVTLTIDIENPPGEDESAPGPLVLTYGTDRQGKGEAPTDENAGQYRARIQRWLAQTRREARLIADLQVVRPSTREDVSSDIRQSF